MTRTFRAQDSTPAHRAQHDGSTVVRLVDHGPSQLHAGQRVFGALLDTGEWTWAWSAELSPTPGW